MHNCQKYRPTFILIALNVAVYVYASVLFGTFLETDYRFIYQWGQVGGFVIYEGQFYQLLTSMFVHASITHIAGSIFEWTTLLAMLVYALVAWGIVKLLFMGKTVSTPEAAEKMNEEEK